MPRLYNAHMRPPTQRLRKQSAEQAYLFRHTLLRDAAYQLQLPRQRAKLHALALEIVDETTESEAERDALSFELAEHARLAAQESEGFERLSLLGREADQLERAAKFSAAKERNADAMQALLRLSVHESLNEARRAHYKLLASAPMALLGRTKDALVLLKEILQWARQAGAIADENAALSTLGEMYTRKGDVDQAEQILTTLLGRAQVGQDKTLQATAQNLLGTLYANTGRLDEAEKLLDSCIVLAQAAGDAKSLCGILSNRAGVAMGKLQYAQARALYERSLESARAQGLRVKEGIVLGTLGWIAVEENRLDEARSLALQALAIARETGDRNGEGYQACTLAGVYSRQDRLDESEQQFIKALAILREVGNRRFEGTTLRDYAELREKQCRLEEACCMFKDAIAIHREVRDRVGEGFAYGRLANVFAKRNLSNECNEAWAKMKQTLNQPADEPLRNFLEEARKVRTEGR